MFSRVTAENAFLVGIDLGCLPPPVTIQRRLARVARLAKRTQVSEVVAAAMLERQDVVDFLYRCRLALR